MAPMPVKSNPDRGIFLLDDGSERRVDPSDMPTACLWLPTTEISLGQRLPGATFEQELINEEEGESIFAMRLR